MASQNLDPFIKYLEGTKGELQIASQNLDPFTKYLEGRKGKL